MIKAIFFDFNGVIIDDETIQMKAYQQVLDGHDIQLTEEWYFDALGMDDRTFVRAMFERAKKPLTDSAWQSVLDAKSIEHRKMIEDQLPLFPGVSLLQRRGAPARASPSGGRRAGRIPSGLLPQAPLLRARDWRSSPMAPERPLPAQARPGLPHLLRVWP